MGLASRARRDQQSLSDPSHRSVQGEGRGVRIGWRERVRCVACHVGVASDGAGVDRSLPETSSRLVAATISAVRDALKTTLGTISGLRVYDTIPDNVNPPCAV